MTDDVDMSEYGIYLHCGNCGAEKKVHTIMDGDVLCKECFRRDLEEGVISKSEILLEIRDNIKEILEKLNKLESNK